MSVKTFLFVHNIGKKRFHNLIKHYQLNGVSCTVHANIRWYSRNAAPFAEEERAVTFIKNYAEIHAVPLPGKLPKSKRLCSYCRLPGHAKTKKGVLTCPKLIVDSTD